MIDEAISDERDAMAMMQGQKLPNGWTVIEVTTMFNHLVVLASDLTASQPRYATWQMQPGDPASTEVGHYFHDLAYAVADYLRRGARLHSLNLAIENEMMKR